MFVRPQLAVSRRTEQRRTLATLRWRDLARRVAGRYRQSQRRMGLTLHWRRPTVKTRWLREHWLREHTLRESWVLTPGTMRLRLSFNLNVNEHETTRDLLRQPGFAPAKAQRTILTSATLHEKQLILRSLVSPAFPLQRFVKPQVITALQPVIMNAGRDVHTAVRQIVRETTRVEHRLIAKREPEARRESETKFAERKNVPSLVTNRAAAVTPTMPEINISQITDQVMRQLDHRISSWRERRGRS